MKLDKRCSKCSHTQLYKSAIEASFFFITFFSQRIIFGNMNLCLNGILQVFSFALAHLLKQCCHSLNNCSRHICFMGHHNSFARPQMHPKYINLLHKPECVTSKSLFCSAFLLTLLAYCTIQECEFCPIQCCCVSHCDPDFNSR